VGFEKPGGARGGRAKERPPGLPTGSESGCRRDQPGFFAPHGRRASAFPPCSPRGDKDFAALGVLGAF